MIKVIKPDSEDQEALRFSSTIFLAGSIEMGAAIDWQNQFLTKLEQVQDKIHKFKPDLEITVYNPRRINWDSSWEQSINNRQFTHQVVWELEKLERCDAIFMLLDENTKSPISLLELGLFARESGTRKLIVFCGEKFWRRGNVEITCERYGIPCHILKGNDFDDQAMNTFITHLKKVSPALWVG